MDTDQYILSIDPGKSSGIALGTFSDTEPYSLVKAWQVGGGMRGLLNAIPGVLAGAHPDVKIAEKFTPLQNSGFNLTLDSVEPLRCEGMLVALGMMPDYPDPTWRRPNEMYLYGGSDLKEKKKRAYAFLKDNGMHLTGKTVGQPDAFDARSATLHGISYVARVKKHRPTFDLISKWCEQNA